MGWPAREAAVQEQRRQDESWDVLDWVDLADSVLGIGNFIVELGVQATMSAFEVAGSLLLGLLD
jgi:hypothetical protein